MSNTALTTMWRKSSRCFKGADCVEAAGLPDGQVGLRDSTNECTAVLTIPASAFGAFTAAIHGGQFDRPTC